MIDEAGTQEALETGIDGDLGQDTGGLFPNTPPPEKPVPKPQAHRGRITGVTAETFDSGTRALKFTWKSLETAADDNLTVFPPQAYIENPLVDASTLSEEEILREDGTKGMSERAKYARTIRNSKGDGTVEGIVKLAQEQGHASSGVASPRTFEQVAEYLNTLVVGTDIIALQKAQGGDGEYADRLRTIRFDNPANIDNPKYWKGYRRLWENQ